MSLDPRLSLAFDLYEDCDLAADIGTDHAHLPIALLRAGKCRRMVLTDLSPDALENARENVGRAGLTDRVTLRLGDGLEPLRETCGTVSLLGMGGRTIQEILLRGRDRLRAAPLILSAHTDLPLVRRAVMEIGYRLVSETPCLDAGRYYLLMKVLPGEEELTPREIRLGKPLFRSASPVLPAYLKHRAEVLSAKLAGLRRGSALREEEAVELEEDIRMLKGEAKP